MVDIEVRISSLVDSTWLLKITVDYDGKMGRSEFY